jgi:hypothetical protein
VGDGEEEKKKREKFFDRLTEYPRCHKRDAPKIRGPVSILDCLLGRACNLEEEKLVNSDGGCRMQCRKEEPETVGFEQVFEEVMGPYARPYTKKKKKTRSNNVYKTMSTVFPELNF